MTELPKGFWQAQALDELLTATQIENLAYGWHIDQDWRFVASYRGVDIARFDDFAKAIQWLRKQPARKIPVGNKEQSIIGY